ncbi:hypothetical protein RND81_12G110500 [Saponaria officinalis]|uniref:Uncharacterized protein n=1 Tax=Saponaria officinalis TaxID=3572 RepID=A0AAW1H969_SAPOF
MIYDSEARSFDVDLKSSEIVCKDSRISYTRESLLSLSEADFCKELPAGVDKSRFRDFIISYSREDLLSLAELNVCKELPYGFDQSIISDLQDASQTAPEIQKLQGHDSLSFGRTSEASTEEFAERWDSFKSIYADSKSKDSEKSNWHQLQRPWENPTTTGVLRNVSQNPEKSGILGSWSGTKPSQGGSEISSLKLPESNSLLSRCSQPYRPPFLKALSHPETPRNDENSNKAFGHSRKQTATEESWRKGPIDLKTNEQLQAIDEKQNSSERNEEVIAKSRACTPLQEHSAIQIVNRFRVSPPILSPVTASVEPLCSTCETAESSLIEDSSKNKPLLQGQDEMSNHVEKLQPHFLEGSRFSALIILKDAEDIDPNLIDEADPASNVKPKSDHRSIVDKGGLAKTQKKGLRTQVDPPLTRSTEKITRNIFPNNAVRKTAYMSTAMKASMRTVVSTKPLSNISNSEGHFRTEHHKDIGIVSEGSHNGFPKDTSDANHLVTEAKPSNGSISENWLPSLQTKHEDIFTDGRDSFKLDSKSVSCSSDNDKAPSDISSWPDLTHDNFWRTATEMSTKENLLDKGQSRETSFYDEELDYTFDELTSSQISEISHFIPSYLFDNESDSDPEINLPDEDSLITVDDTYIFQEEILNQSPVSNKPMQTDVRHQNLLLPDTWLRDSQLNVAKMFVNPLNTQADLRAPPQLQDPRRFNHYNYVPFPADAISIGQPPLMPQFYEHTVEPTHNFYSYLNNTLPPDPPSYHQVHQMPWRQPEPDLLRNLPLNYQGNINSAYMELRGRHGGEVELRPTFSQIIQIGRQAEKEIRPTFSQMIQMQIGIAKMKLETLPGFKQRAYRKPISNPNR